MIAFPLLLSPVRTVGISLLVGMSCVLPLTVPRASAQTTAATYSVLHVFSTLDGFGANGDGFSARELTRGSDGNFYGAASSGGAHGTGTLFKLTSSGTLTTLYSFSALVGGNANSRGTNGDGVGPEALTLGSDGNFYGVTTQGGLNGEGTVFKVTPAGALTNLHNFDTPDSAFNNVDGFGPRRLVQGADGNFYGTASGGGANDYGTLFRITPTGSFSVLHTFANVDSGINGDGAFPNDLLLGSDGHLYGTTSYGGTHANGTIFRCTTEGALTTLYHFDATDNNEGNANGAKPGAGLTLGSDGNFYGTTFIGGPDANGTIYKFSPAGVLTNLHSFSATDDAGFNGDGKLSFSRPVEGRDGNFYGTTQEGGANGRGTIYQITPAGVFTVVRSFSALDNYNHTTQVGTNADGAICDDALTPGSDGNFYGATFTGGPNGTGVIFKLALDGTRAAFFTGEGSVGNGVYYLTLLSGNSFGYYSYLPDTNYIYHFDLGFEYVFDAMDGKSGVYFYDFKSNGFFYTSPSFPFPYLYDFSLDSTVYYYPDPNNAGRYNTNGVRYFYVFKTGKIISK